MAAICMCMMRRLNQLRNNGFVPVLIDVMVIFTGGGNLHMHHRLEKWFFAILSIGAFFINAICLEETVFPSYLQPMQRIQTFEEVAKLNVPVYIGNTLKRNQFLIKEMLR